MIIQHNGMMLQARPERQLIHHETSWKEKETQAVAPSLVW